MWKAWTTAAILLLFALGLGLTLELRSPGEAGAPASRSKPAASAAQRPLSPVDLTAFYDQDPSFDDPGSPWQAVPHGLQVFGNAPFRVEGLVHLWGEGQAGLGRVYRDRVEGIPATGKFQALYVLHGASFTTAEGTPVAEVVFRYADRSSATNSILYGTDSRDWWRPLSEHNPFPANSRSKIVWRGDHQSLPDWVKSLRLFGTDVANPKPDSEVKRIDLVSTKSRVSWSVLALTTGPEGVLHVDSSLEQDDNVPVQEMTMVLSAVDKDSGHPVKDVRFQVTLLSGRRPKSYGLFTPDEKGEALVDLPPEHIKRLSIRTISTDYLPLEMSWNVEHGGTIPTNYVFRIPKAARQGSRTD